MQMSQYRTFKQICNFFFRFCNVPRSIIAKFIYSTKSPQANFDFQVDSDKPDKVNKS